MSHDESRRKFCQRGLVGIGTVFGLSAVGSGAAFLGSPAFTNITEGQWIEVGSTDDFNEDGYSQVVLEFPIQDGWMYGEMRMLAYVRKKGDKYIALSAVCSHLGCNVRYEEEKKEFFCPCHSGVYDFDGINIAGPPPHPLQSLKVKEEEGVLFVYNKQEEESDGEEA